MQHLAILLKKSRNDEARAERLGKGTVGRGLHGPLKPSWGVQEDAAEGEEA